MNWCHKLTYVCWFGCVYNTNYNLMIFNEDERYRNFPRLKTSGYIFYNPIKNNYYLVSYWLRIIMFYWFYLKIYELWIFSIFLLFLPFIVIISSGLKICYCYTRERGWGWQSGDGQVSTFYLENVNKTIVQLTWGESWKYFILFNIFFSIFADFCYWQSERWQMICHPSSERISSRDIVGDSSCTTYIV